MPLYEYCCTSCGERTEALQHLGDALLSECQRCGGALEKLLSAPALQFKGTGWYVTDYGNRHVTTADNDKSAAGKGNGSKVESKTAEKPAPTKERTAKAQ